MPGFDLRHFDWLTLGLVLLLMGMSLITLASLDSFFFHRQILWGVLGLLIILAGSQVNWEWLITQSWFRQSFYWISVLLLLVPFAQPGTVRGTESWIVIGGFQFQPSELVKITLLIVLAGFFTKKYVSAWRGKNILYSAFYAFLPMGIVALQSDLGSAFIIGSIWAGFILLGGLTKKRILVSLLIVALVFLLLWFFFMQPYQQERILSFVYPERSPLGSNYNVIQSKIAIGSAGFFGKGFQSGTQSQLGFLPEAHTDFLFASFVEEWGMLGGLVLILTYLGLLVRIALTGLEVRRNDLKLVAFGMGVIFFLHFCINIGSNLGLVPVIGVSLPFLSYGGSNLLTSALLLGIMERIKSVQYSS